MSILEKAKEVAEEIKEKVLGEEPKEEIQPEVTEEALENGEKLSEEEKAAAAEGAENLEDVAAQSEFIPSGVEVKTYQGKKIIAEKTSIINEKEYITLTLEDGLICQLSEGEYNEGVK